MGRYSPHRISGQIGSSLHPSPSQVRMDESGNPEGHTNYLNGKPYERWFVNVPDPGTEFP
jgi:hypothetical protein